MTNRLLLLVLLFTLINCKEDPEERLQKAIRYAKQKDYVSAIGTLDFIIQDNPDYVDAYINKSYFLQAYGKTERAIAAMDKAIELDSLCDECYQWRGHLRKGYDAIIDLDKAIELNDKDFMSFQFRGFAKRDLKDFYGAIEDFGHALKLCHYRTDSASLLGDLALANIDLSMFKEAKQDIDLALRLDPKNAIHHFALFSILVMSEAPRRLAKIEYDKCLKLGLDSAMARKAKVLLQVLEKKDDQRLKAARDKSNT